MGKRVWATGRGVRPSWRAAAAGVALAGTLAAAGYPGLAVARAGVQEPPLYLAATILPGMKRGADGNLHDAFSPATFHLVAGEPAILTVYNYDDMPHSITVNALHLNIVAKPSHKQGVPGITQVRFIVNRPGRYLWYCALPCDLRHHGWAMSHLGYMEGYLYVAPRPR